MITETKAIGNCTKGVGVKVETNGTGIKVGKMRCPVTGEQAVVTKTYHDIEEKIESVTCGQGMQVGKRRGECIFSKRERTSMPRLIL